MIYSTDVHACYPWSPARGVLGLSLNHPFGASYLTRLITSIAFHFLFACLTYRPLCCKNVARIKLSDKLLYYVCWLFRGLMEWVDQSSCSQSVAQSLISGLQSQRNALFIQLNSFSASCSSKRYNKPFFLFCFCFLEKQQMTPLKPLNICNAI